MGESTATRLARLETKLDLVMAALEKRNNRDDRNDADTDGRLRKVENRQYWMSGVNAVAGMMLGALLAYWTQRPA